MMLRRATHTDIPQLVELFLRLKRVSDYKTIPHDLERARATMRRCISSPQGYLSVVERGGVIVAALMGIVEEFWWSSRRYASDLAFFSQVPGAGEALIRDFCEWAWKQRGVIEVLPGQSSGLDPEGTRNFFESLGFEYAGGIYRLTRYEALGAAA